jgi:hypothetical protein
MAARSTSTQMASAARAALAAALLSLDDGTTVIDGAGSAVVVVLPNGAQLRLDVMALAVVDETRAEQIASRALRETVVVADVITAAARRALTTAHVGWLDRRGHLCVTTPDVWIDRAITPMPRQPRRSGGTDPIRGAAAIGVAAGHLIDPQAFNGVRPMARILGLSPAAVSAARAGLTARGLLGDDAPSRAALFTALSDAWKPTWVELSSRPTPQSDLIATSTRAAITRGVPITATDNYPIDLYTTNDGNYQRTLLRAGTNTAAHAPAARLARAPTPLVSEHRTLDDIDVDGYPAAHPLFIALDLATDPARGTEALQQWNPPGWPRAW